MYINQIEQRVSIRTYKNTSLNKVDEFKITQLLEKSKTWVGPFGSLIHTFFLTQNNIKEQERIGTYGFIKNAPAYFGASTKNSKNEIIDFGYIFEKLILELTELQFGTVWLGGTFHRSQFSHFCINDEFIPAISPVGYEDEKSYTEKIIRIAAKSNRRKRIDEFVFINDFSHNLNEDHLVLHQIFRYVQLAPSASNKQPWRFLIKNNEIHLYLDRTPKYAEKLPFDIQYLDMGIAIYHLECAFIDHKINYKVSSSSNTLEITPFEYITSFILDDGFIS